MRCASQSLQCAEECEKGIFYVQLDINCTLMRLIGIQLCRHSKFTTNTNIFHLTKYNEDSIRGIPHDKANLDNTSLSFFSSTRLNNNTFLI